tara:strand:+ start:13243 stop:14958 length:1716 start_codon:yes stop_codon:yes gene_type:complete
MIENLRTRIIITVLVLATAVVWMVPNIQDMSEKWWPSKEKLIYGLDIQGGLHLVLRVDIQGVLEEKITRQAHALESNMKGRAVAFKEIKPVDGSTSELIVTVNSTAEAEGVEKFVDEFLINEFQVIESEGTELRLRYLDTALTNYKSQVIDQAIEVIRNRIDEFGVSEPLITAQGDDRILVQLPGVKDSASAKELINRTARLSFRLVHDEFGDEKVAELVQQAEKDGGYSLGQDELGYSDYVERINTDLKGKIPEGWKVVFEKDKAAKTLEAGKIAYLVERTADLSGDMLDDAWVGRGEYNEPEVNFRFNIEGRRLFADMTGNNIDRRMAIVLDDVIKSVANIQTKIDTESARITLGRTNYQETLDEANFISTALRAGALPAALEQLEERTVGPTLGADSIARGKQAGIIGGILVLIFMIIYYRKLGVVADVALAMNILLVLAVLTSLGATLTLPGVAGIVLTVGMAVDANVIIFERIKEELAKGAGLKSAIKDGFGHAFSAIFDANITTAAVCIVLMKFGTGPVRGFAVTLLCGIATSMFTAIFVSRTMLEVLINKFNMKNLLVVKARNS